VGPQVRYGTTRWRILPYGPARHYYAEAFCSMPDHCFRFVHSARREAQMTISKMRRHSYRLARTSATSRLLAVGAPPTASECCGATSTGAWARDSGESVCRRSRSVRRLVGYLLFTGKRGSTDGGRRLVSQTRPGGCWPARRTGPLAEPSPSGPTPIFRHHGEVLCEEWPTWTTPAVPPSKQRRLVPPLNLQRDQAASSAPWWSP
jgi:hypothetical protein